MLLVLEIKGCFYYRVNEALFSRQISMDSNKDELRQYEIIQNALVLCRIEIDMVYLIVCIA